MDSMIKQEFSKIVVPIDGSTNSMEAADFAIQMAEKYAAKLIVIHVVNVDQYIQSLGLYRISYPEFVKKKIEMARNEANKWFAQITKDAEQRKVSVVTDVIDSPQSIVGTIVDYADNNNADLIVIGTRGRSGFTKLLLGSVASGVITYSTCPVLVLKK
jgi:nucleotide-binding universal stress UspA family protein